MNQDFIRKNSTQPRKLPSLKPLITSCKIIQMMFLMLYNLRKLLQE